MVSLISGPLFSFECQRGRWRRPTDEPIKAGGARLDLSRAADIGRFDQSTFESSRFSAAPPPSGGAGHGISVGGQHPGVASCQRCLPWTFVAEQRRRIAGHDAGSRFLRQPASQSDAWCRPSGIGSENAHHSLVAAGRRHAVARP